MFVISKRLKTTTTKCGEKTPLSYLEVDVVESFWKCSFSDPLWRVFIRNNACRIAWNLFFEFLDLLGPEPDFGQLGLGVSSGGYSSHGYSVPSTLLMPRFAPTVLSSEGTVLLQKTYKTFLIWFFKQGQWTII